MNKIKITLTAITLILCATSFAQELSKKEKKALQKEMLKKAEAMDPVKLKAMFDEYPNLSSEVKSLESQVSSLESDLSSKDKEISNLKSQLDNANAMNSGGNSSSDDSNSEETTTSTPTKTSSKTIPGLVYKVQIGAFRNKDLTKYFNNSSNFGGEVDADGTKKYSIGQFKEYWEADSFKKYMREMGVKDAWIVPYYNGKRISMKDAREGVFN